jgi:hypothetical protein
MFELRKHPINAKSVYDVKIESASKDTANFFFGID